MPTPRTRPVWPAYTIALLALFCALGGPAYAAGLVTGADIKDGSVTSADVRNDSLKGTDVRDGSLAGKDLSAAARAALAGATGPSGTAGACGEGQELRWLQVALTSDGVPVDRTLRVGRCVGTGDPVMGDGVVQGGEQCDDAGTISGDGCTATGMLEGSVGLDLAPDGELRYVP